METCGVARNRKTDREGGGERQVDASGTLTRRGRTETHRPVPVPPPSHPHEVPGYILGTTRELASKMSPNSERKKSTDPFPVTYRLSIL